MQMPSRMEVLSWDVNKVGDLLREQKLLDCVDCIFQRHIDGQKLLNLKEGDVMYFLEIHNEKSRRKFWDLIKKITEKNSSMQNIMSNFEVNQVNNRNNVEDNMKLNDDQWDDDNDDDLDDDDPSFASDDSLSENEILYDSPDSSDLPVKPDKPAKLDKPQVSLERRETIKNSLLKLIAPDPECCKGQQATVDLQSSYPDDIYDMPEDGCGALDSDDDYETPEDSGGGVVRRIDHAQVTRQISEQYVQPEAPQHTPDLYEDINGAQAPTEEYVLPHPCTSSLTTEVIIPPRPPKKAPSKTAQKSPPFHEDHVDDKVTTERSRQPKPDMKPAVTLVKKPDKPVAKPAFKPVPQPPWGKPVIKPTVKPVPHQPALEKAVVKQPTVPSVPSKPPNGPPPPPSRPPKNNHLIEEEEYQLPELQRGPKQPQTQEPINYPPQPPRKPKVEEQHGSDPDEYELTEPQREPKKELVEQTNYEPPPQPPRKPKVKEPVEELEQLNYEIPDLGEQLNYEIPETKLEVGPPHKKETFSFMHKITGKKATDNLPSSPEKKSGFDKRCKRRSLTERILHKHNNAHHEGKYQRNTSPPEEKTDHVETRPVNNNNPPAVPKTRPPSSVPQIKTDHVESRPVHPPALPKTRPPSSPALRKLPQRPDKPDGNPVTSSKAVDSPQPKQAPVVPKKSTPVPVPRTAGTPPQIPAATKSKGTLHNQPWFHGKLSKESYLEMLKISNQDGAFLVRQSSKNAAICVLSVYIQADIRHLEMPHENGQYRLGKSGKVKFDSIVELIEYFKKNEIDFSAGGHTRLTHACVKH